MDRRQIEQSCDTGILASDLSDSFFQPPLQQHPSASFFNNSTLRDLYTSSLNEPEPEEVSFSPVPESDKVIGSKEVKLARKQERDELLDAYNELKDLVV